MPEAGLRNSNYELTDNSESCQICKYCDYFYEDRVYWCYKHVCRVDKNGLCRVFDTIKKSTSDELGDRRMY